MWCRWALPLALWLLFVIVVLSCTRLALVCLGDPWVLGFPLSDLQEQQVRHLVSWAGASVPGS